MSTSVSRTTTVSAPPERVWELVSDLPAMGDHSPENTGGSWLDGVSPPHVGARFRGSNTRGLRRWRTTATVTQSDPGRAFAFDVGFAGRPTAEWRYEITATPQGCSVTETWTDRRGAVVTRLGAPLTGVRDRAGFTAQSIEQTLASIKARAEG